MNIYLFLFISIYTCIENKYHQLRMLPIIISVYTETMCKSESMCGNCGTWKNSTFVEFLSSPNIFIILDTLTHCAKFQ